MTDQTHGCNMTHLQLLSFSKRITSVTPDVVIRFDGILNKSPPMDETPQNIYSFLDNLRGGIQKLRRPAARLLACFNEGGVVPKGCLKLIPVACARTGARCLLSITAISSNRRIRGVRAKSVLEILNIYNTRCSLPSFPGQVRYAINSRKSSSQLRNDTLNHGQTGTLKAKIIPLNFASSFKISSAETKDLPHNVSKLIHKIERRRGVNKTIFRNKHLRSRSSNRLV